MFSTLQPGKSLPLCISPPFRAEAPSPRPPCLHTFLKWLQVKRPSWVVYKVCSIWHFLFSVGLVYISDSALTQFQSFLQPWEGIAKLHVSPQLIAILDHLSLNSLTRSGALVEVPSRLLFTGPVNVFLVPASHWARDHIIITGCNSIKAVKFALIFIIVKLCCIKKKRNERLSFQG